MNSREYRSLLDLFMASDPWPLSDGQHETMKELLNREAQDRGYETWVHAYHEL